MLESTHLYPTPTFTPLLRLTCTLRSPPSPTLMPRSPPSPTFTRRSPPRSMCMRISLLSLTLMSRSPPSPTFTRRSPLRSMCMRMSLLRPTSMSRSPLSPTSTRSPSPSPPPSSPLPQLLSTTPQWPPLLWPTTTPLLQLPRLLLPQWLPTTTLLPQLPTTTTSDMLPLPTPMLLPSPRLPKRCHTTFDDEDIQRKYLRQAVINCDKRIS